MAKAKGAALFGGGAPPGRTGGGPKSLSRIMFDKFDADGSGGIDGQEFKLLCYDFGYFLNDEELELAVKEVDTQGNGTISYEDFTKWWNTSDRFEQLHLDDEALKLRRKASETFQKFDKHKTGVINTGDFSEFYGYLRQEKLTDKDEASCLADLDTNRDCNIQFNEYVDWLVRIGTLNVKTFLGGDKFKGGQDSAGIKESQEKKAALKPTRAGGGAKPAEPSAAVAAYNKPVLKKTVTKERAGGAGAGAQGGKAFGQRKGTVKEECQRINEEYRDKATDEELATYTTKFMEYDEDGSGDIDLLELGRMMEKIGQPKNQIQLRKMIQEVDQEGGGTITYRSFLAMMLGGSSSSILAKILAFEAMNKKPEQPKGPPPKKSLADLM